jgi:hypothetical protein
MKKETFLRDKADRAYDKAVWFIERLMAKGIPLGAIDTNDFHSSIPAVYINYGFTRHYKKYYRFTEQNVERAAKWWDKL